jgi:hypothetical protein
MIINHEEHWLRDACIICGCLVGATFGFCMREMSGAIFGGILGIAIGYAVTLKSEVERER